ncbi:polysaccharide deacetylase family protein [Romboutsia weinsteinii]|nr:polysaccharide deacetylase family protein [Romboutsia weinsteinii]
MWNRFVQWATKTPELTTYNVYSDDFEEQMTKLVESGAYFATLNELFEFKNTGKYPDKCVWISFDDVDESVYKNAFPILKEKNIPFTLFVISGQVGSQNFNNLKLASWDNLREMRDSGLVSFASHTYNMHYLQDDKAVFLHEENYDQFKKDIEMSKETMKKELGIDVTTIAYPYGETSDDITKIVKESGFEGAYILSPNPISADNDLYYQNRYLVDNEVFERIILPWVNKDNK